MIHVFSTMVLNGYNRLMFIELFMLVNTTILIGLNPEMNLTMRLGELTFQLIIQFSLKKSHIGILKSLVELPTPTVLLRVHWDGQIVLIEKSQQMHMIGLLMDNLLEKLLNTMDLLWQLLKDVDTPFLGIAPYQVLSLLRIF